MEGFLIVGVRGKGSYSLGDENNQEFCVIAIV